MTPARTVRVIHLSAVPTAALRAWIEQMAPGAVVTPAGVYVDGRDAERRVRGVLAAHAVAPLTTPPPAAEGERP